MVATDFDEDLIANLRDALAVLCRGVEDSFVGIDGDRLGDALNVWLDLEK